MVTTMNEIDSSVHCCKFVVIDNNMYGILIYQNSSH